MGASAPAGRGLFKFIKEEKKGRIKMTAVLEQPYTHDTLYKTMHCTHDGYRHKNQGVARFCDWLHLLTNDRGIVHDPWSDTALTVLELGCGNGKLCMLLVSLGMDVTGSDIFDNKVIYDRSPFKFVKHDMMVTPYPFKDHEFEYTCSFDVLEHLPQPYIAPALQEMARISTSGIFVAVSCTGEKPLHLTIQSPGWWLNQLIDNCADFSWQLLRNHERIAIEEGNRGRIQKSASDIRPFKNGERITYAPLFFGKRGRIGED